MSLRDGADLAVEISLLWNKNTRSQWIPYAHRYTKASVLRQPAHGNKLTITAVLVVKQVLHLYLCDGSSSCKHIIGPGWE